MEAYWKARLPNSHSQQTSPHSGTPTYQRALSTVKLHLEKARERHSSIRDSFGLRSAKQTPSQSILHPNSIIKHSD